MRQSGVIRELGGLGISPDKTIVSELDAPSEHGTIAEQRQAAAQISEMADALSEMVLNIRSQMREIDDRLRAIDARLSGTHGNSVS